jgi:hypothetical protein
MHFLYRQTGIYTEKILRRQKNLKRGINDMQNKETENMSMPEEALKPGTWTSLPSGGIIFVKHPSDAEMADLYALTQVEISPDVAPIEDVLAVYNHNRDAFLGIYTADDETRKNAHFVGYYSFLHLTPQGRELLENGTLNVLHPEIQYLVPFGQRPAAIYVWAIVARKVNKYVMPLIAKALGAELYGGVPLYATAGTLGGYGAMKGVGFEGAKEKNAGLGQLFRLDAPPPSAIRAA